MKTERSGDPHRESKPSAHAPAPHARHDRSMARNRSVARPILENFLLSGRPPRPTSIGFKDVVVQESFVFSSISSSTWRVHGSQRSRHVTKTMVF